MAKERSKEYATWNFILDFDHPKRHRQSGTLKSDLSHQKMRMEFLSISQVWAIRIAGSFLGQPIPLSLKFDLILLHNLFPGARTRPAECEIAKNDSIEC